VCLRGSVLREHYPAKWVSFQRASTALGLFGLMAGLVIGLPNTALLLILEFFGAERAFVATIAACEAWLLSGYLFLVAYAAHSHIEIGHTVSPAGIAK
jgi:hypothetical protein